MTAELASLEQKWEARFASLGAKLDLALAKLDEMNKAGKPGLTQREFAKLIGKTPRTVARWVSDKKIRLQRGLVPHEQVRQYLS